MTDPIEQQVRQIAADVLNLPPSQVTRETLSRTVATWDSVQHLNFILALEQAFGIQLEPEEIEQMLSVGAAIDVVKSKS